MCGTCCYGEGGIFVQGKEIEAIAGFLGITPESFVSEFCRKKGRRFSINTGPDKFCIFFDKEKGCLIHPAKPKICISWPFYKALLSDIDNWDMAKDACPGINPDCSFEEFLRQAGE